MFTAGQTMGQRAALLLVICLVSLVDANYGFLLKLLFPKQIYTIGMPHFLKLKQGFWTTNYKKKFLFYCTVLVIHLYNSGILISKVQLINFLLQHFKYYEFWQIRVLKIKKDYIILFYVIQTNFLSISISRIWLNAGLILYMVEMVIFAFSLTNLIGMNWTKSISCSLFSCFYIR